VIRLVLLVVAIVLFVVACWPAATARIHLGWAGLAFLAAALAVG
jgi:hypothetical protein